MPKNAWMEHVSRVKAKNKGKSLKEILIMASKSYKKPAQRGGAVVPPQILKLQNSLWGPGGVFKVTGPPRAQTPWYMTPFEGVRNAATHIRDDPFTNSVVSKIPYAGDAILQASKKIGRGKRKNK